MLQRTTDTHNKKHPYELAFTSYCKYTWGTNAYTFFSCMGQVHRHYGKKKTCDYRRSIYPGYLL